MRPGGLTASPAMITGYVGSRVEPQVYQKSLLSKKDVSRQVIGISYDPRVARFNPTTGQIMLTGVGTTTVRFQLGDLKTEVAVAANPSANPDKIVIEPKTVELAVGSTARLKLIGEYKDGSRVDLTGAAEWTAQNDGKLFTQAVWSKDWPPDLRPLRPDTGPIRKVPTSTRPPPRMLLTSHSKRSKWASIRTPWALAWVDAFARTPWPPMVRNTPSWSRPVEDRGQSALSRLGRGAEPSRPTRGRRQAGRHVRPEPPGRRRRVQSGRPRPFGAEVRPENLDMVVGEIADIDYISPERGPVRLSSAKPGVVDITASNRIIARTAGDTQIDVSREAGRSAPST